jgi:uncharacterized Fe-S cluster-containing radical SAM superfamily protein
MYDPVKRTKSLEKIAFQGSDRRYYRFRGAKWYGGIATGDVAVCNLRCVFCWAGDNIMDKPQDVGRFYTPEDAFSRLERIATKGGYSQLRLSGQEPTIGRDHLLCLLRLVEESHYRFILETNGVLLGSEPDYASDLSGFRNLHVRVSLKGTCEEEFGLVTGADPESFKLQLAALANLRDAKVSCHPAVMVSFSSKENFATLSDRLDEIDKDLFQQLEIEELITYPHVTKRLEEAGFTAGTARASAEVPDDSD